LGLVAGTKLGAYEIVALLGAGGMGEVYRARDTRLGRDVAIKVIPATFSTDTDRLQRFEQEARAAAALNHPNILAVHDVGTHAGAPFIVSELLEGETLRERLAHGPMPVRKAIDLGIQIAQALAAAHEKGIVHRDLKPENIFINKDGRAKILDFGLAKLTQTESPLVAGTNVPTTPAGNLTQAGVMLGTIGYMAPEQVRGHAVDHRADIFAFGAILYEMLSGHRAFRGETSIDAVSAILKEDPPDLPITEKHIPPALARIVDRCLEKNPTARFASAADLAFALEALTSASGSAAAPAVPDGPRGSSRRERIAWAAAAACVVGFGLTVPTTVTHWRERPTAPPAIRFAISPPDDGVLPPAGGPAISPDGRHIAYFASSKAGTTPVLWVRSLDSHESRVVPGSEGGGAPFWSPDGTAIGFFAQVGIKKINVAGGVAQTVATIPGRGRGAGVVNSASWGADNTILFSHVRLEGGLSKVPAGGGEPSRVTTLNATAKDTAHVAPSFLPDGRRFLYFALPSKTIHLASLDSTETKQLLSADSRAAYAAPGHLVFVRGTTLLAQPFDAGSGELRGDAFPIDEKPLTNPPIGAAAFGTSNSNVLAYRLGEQTVERLTEWGRDGKPIRVSDEQDDYRDIALSRDGTRLMLHRHDDTIAGGGLWLLDRTRNTTSRFTFDLSHNVTAQWSPKDDKVAFGSDRDGGRMNIYWKDASGAGPDELLLKTEDPTNLSDWSRDGRFLIYSMMSAKSDSDIWVLPLGDDRKPFPFLRTDAGEGIGRLSPDGRWMAYVSNETGRNQVYVQPFPATGGKWQISPNGGTQPRWRADGKELYYLGPGTRPQHLSMMAVSMAATGTILRPSIPSLLFETTFSGALAIGGGMNPGLITQSYAVSNDGQRFFVLSLVPTEARPEIKVIVNWSEAFRK
jgi:serine/threonine protein kinase/Tol biopolymer transport system component